MPRSVVEIRKDRCVVEWNEGEPTVQRLKTCCHGYRWYYSPQLAEQERPRGRYACPECIAGQCETMQRRRNPKRWLPGIDLESEELAQWFASLPVVDDLGSYQPVVANMGPGAVAFSDGCGFGPAGEPPILIEVNEGRFVSDQIPPGARRIRITGVSEREADRMIRAFHEDSG